MSSKYRWSLTPRWRVVAMIAIGVGVGLRLGAFLQARPLWLDEAMLALNVMGHGYRDLLQPLAYDQAAPPLFLWVAKAVGSMADGNAAALRLLALLPGLALLWATWWFGRTVFSPATGATATVLVACSPSLIYYSNEFKPYMGDALLTLLLVGLAWEVGARAPGRRSWWFLGGIGLVSLGLSNVAPIALATSGVMLLLRGRRAGLSWRSLAPHFGLGVVWLATFSLLYAAVIRPAAANAYLQEFWAPGFLLNQPSLVMALYFVGSALTLPLPLPVTAVRMAVLLPVLAGLGLVAMYRYGLVRLTPWITLVGISLIVSLCSLYPVEGRLMLFAGPLSLIALSAGLTGALGAMVAPDWIRTGLLGGILVVLIAWAQAPLGRGPGSGEWVPTVVPQLLLRPPEAQLYVLNGAGPRYVYYSTDWAAPDVGRLEWYARQMSWGGGGFRNANRPSGLPSPLSPPGHPRETLAHSSGALGGSGDSVVAAWAVREVRQLLDSYAGEVWVYGGRYRERELPFLQEALSDSGVRWSVTYESPWETVLVIRPAGLP